MPHPKLHAARYRRHTLAEVEHEILQLIDAPEAPDDILRERLHALLDTYEPTSATTTA